MKPNHFLLLAVSLFFAGTLLAQRKTDLLLHLKNGPVQTTSNISKQVIDSFNSKMIRTNNKSFAIIQFESIPTQEIRNQLSVNGIELLEYIPNKAYTVSISGDANLIALQSAKARSIISLTGKQKMQSLLADGKIPSWAIKVQGTVDLWISFPKTFSVTEVTAQLKQLNADIVSTQYQNFRILTIRIATSRIEEIASYPFVEFMQPIPSGDQVLNFNSRSGSRANVLNASIANGGKGLNGEGIVVGVGDNADLQDNIDFAGRLINRSASPINAGHGHHTSGTATGNGNGLEQYRGYAPNATIISATFNGIILNAPAYVNDYGMVITNNSYGDNIECSYHGTYDLYSRLLDQMAFDLPNLTNVFSAGNSGLNTCAPALPNYHTVLGGYQSAKNVVTVGATTDSGAISGFSSRGPVRDGRTKPEIVAQGQLVASNWFGNIYGFNNGTSMSGPAVAGGLSLLYQRYRQLNSGSNPKNGLMKAILVNGAIDKGNAGPDFQYGYGWMNLLRSIDMLENNRYFNANVVQGTSNTHTINVPANAAYLKVMLYWNDPAASPLSAHTLVNDLDLEVVNSTSATLLPFKLDTANLNVGSVAINGDDHINNMEQVVINGPVSGNYTFRVKGNAITQNPSQEYFLVYDIIPVQLRLTAPFGGDVIAPSTVALDRTRIRWEAFGYPSGTIIIEFSSDNGTNWTTLASNVDINRTTYTWFVPNIATSQARIRLTKEGSGEISMSDPFTIIDRSVVSLAPVQCEGYINIQWTAVAGATDYEVMMLQGNTMMPVGITSGTTYGFSGLSKDSTYWFSVRSRVNGIAGTRAAAISRQPNSGTCTGSFSDNDLKLDAILSPLSGRKFTSNQLSSTSTISIRIKNLDDAPVNNFDVKYSINGSAFITENVTASIAAGATYTHIFSTSVDLSVPGNYNLVTVVKNNTTDVVTANDTAVRLVKHLDNQPIDISSYFVDNIETAISASYEKDTIGLTGLDRYDLSRSTIYGRLRTFINSGMAYSGSKALTLDANRYYVPGNTNYLYGTYNLTN
ncbi:MAG: S8 family serine peptidase, partial [Flavisolibacter sp.]